MRTNIIALILISTLLAATAGCSSWFRSDFQDPQLHLLRVDVIKAKLHEQRFALHFRVENPNAFELPVRGLKYTVHLNGLPLATGESSTWINVPAHGQREFEVPVRTNLWRHLKGLVKSLETPEQPIRYGLYGDLKTGVLFGRNVHIQSNGEIIPGDYIPE